jgi:AbrB family looped-hinge helix DNA binding protein
MAQATLTSKGQITIPKSVRDSLHLHSGDRVEFIVQGDKEALVKPVTKTAAEVFGKLFKPGRPRKSVEQMNEAVVRSLKERSR